MLFSIVAAGALLACCTGYPRGKIVLCGRVIG